MNRRTFFGLRLTGIGALTVPGNAWALKFYPRPSDRKWAVLYATWCGSARDAAVWISEGQSQRALHRVRQHAAASDP